MKLLITMILVTDDHPDDPDENQIGVQRAITNEALDLLGKNIVAEVTQAMYRAIMEKYEESRR